MQENKDLLQLVIKNNYLESQNVQLLLNLQLQARTIIDLKNMIHKQQTFIEDNHIGQSPSAQNQNIDIFLGEDDQDIDDIDEPNEEDDKRNELRFSNNGPPLDKPSLDGFEGIVGVGANKRIYSKPIQPVKKEIAKLKPKEKEEKKEGPPLSLGVFGSGM